MTTLEGVLLHLEIYVLGTEVNLAREHLLDIFLCVRQIDGHGDFCSRTTSISFEFSPQPTHSLDSSAPLDSNTREKTTEKIYNNKIRE